MATPLSEFSAEVQQRIENTPLAPGEDPEDLRGRITRQVAAEWMRQCPGRLLEVVNELDQARRSTPS